MQKGPRNAYLGQKSQILVLPINCQITATVSAKNLHQNQVAINWNKLIFSKDFCNYGY